MNLIEDYKRRLHNVNEILEKSSNLSDDKKVARLKTKAAEYRTFIAELEREIKNSPRTYSKDEAIEIGMISAIISDVIFKELYEKHDIGYIAASDTIGQWAVEFFEKHKDANWEEVLNNGMNVLSEKFKGTEGGKFICWDDVVIDFAYFKLENI